MALRGDNKKEDDTRNVEELTPEALRRNSLYKNFVRNQE